MSVTWSHVPLTLTHVSELLCNINYYWTYRIIVGIFWKLTRNVFVNWIWLIFNCWIILYFTLIIKLNVWHWSYILWLSWYWTLMEDAFKWINKTWCLKHFYAFAENFFYSWCLNRCLSGQLYKDIYRQYEHISKTILTRLLLCYGYFNEIFCIFIRNKTCVV